MNNGVDSHLINKNIIEDFDNKIKQQYLMHLILLNRINVLKNNDANFNDKKILGIDNKEKNIISNLRFDIEFFQDLLENESSIEFFINWAERNYSELLFMYNYMYSKHNKIVSKYEQSGNNLQENRPQILRKAKKY